ncbi:hypothetical protein CAEBREN_21253 [Caenorhabditis brenneri]|uniref:Post-SET domain-containing protein n=1 Tax=Caenorhabditis brenneri TaxID=135651 RepID=G0NGI4_CAEBE|nr:hypothetical protein CAEBREN_21253 [Caenorhabditis brenneri]
MDQLSSKHGGDSLIMSNPEALLSSRVEFVAALQTIEEVIGLLHPDHGHLRVGNENYHGRSTDAMLRDVVLGMEQHDRRVSLTIHGNLSGEKWSVPRLEADKEINFDYQFNNDDQKCHCDSDNCKKFIGRVPAEFVPEDKDKELPEELSKLQQMSNQEEKREFIEQLLSEFTIQNCATERNKFREYDQ